MNEPGIDTKNKSSTSLLSDISLIITNMIPLAGVLLFEWNVLTVLMLYWAESGIVGLYNIIKMLKTDSKRKLPKILFFMLHYGGFMCGHYFFLYIGGIFMGMIGLSMIDKGLFAPLLENQTSLIALLIMFISHGISFFRNFIFKKEYEKTSIDILMGKPYGRVLIMQVVILLSAFIMVFLLPESPAVAVIILVAMKTLIDFIAHKKGHKAELEG